MDFIKETGSLDLPNLKKLDLDQELFYFIDFTKLKSVEDLIKIMAAMGFGLSNKHFQFEEIKQFLDLDRPVRPQ